MSLERSERETERQNPTVLLLQSEHALCVLTDAHCSGEASPECCNWQSSDEAPTPLFLPRLRPPTSQFKASASRNVSSAAFIATVQWTALLALVNGKRDKSSKHATTKPPTIPSFPSLCLSLSPPPSSSAVWVPCDAFEHSIQNTELQSQHADPKAPLCLRSELLFDFIPLSCQFLMTRCRFLARGRWWWWRLTSLKTCNRRTVFVAQKTPRRGRGSFRFAHSV
ncbi:hypothetical protein CAOG_010094 [Capsaspora owczarzaki ATCC 30864]|uniref:Uncharacterized protein n=1 Tax=Capsaspora owczarzaki (strain ATCC 30864) TaxID=595528 RepID=A0A0D2UQD9_CAPO3|nr:hypothetical protein CAOG_010094 [Capsaspora owczarzaki ATCC 30864]